MQNLSFTNILIFSRHPQASKTSIPDLIDALEHLDVNIFIEDETAELCPDCDFPTKNKKDIADCDLALVVGGDGSLLAISEEACKQDVPLLGLNRGKLGFLADIPASQTTTIANIVQGEYIEEERWILQAHHYNQQTQEKTFLATAVNEVMLTRGDLMHMLHFDLFIDDEFIYYQHADGILITTPTGSTAYAMSAGGPILHPQLNAISLVPLCPHKLNTRPVVIDKQHQIQLVPKIQNDRNPIIWCDGRQKKIIGPGEEVHISVFPKKIKLIHPKDYRFYDTLKAKLHWERKSNARFT